MAASGESVESRADRKQKQLNEQNPCAARPGDAFKDCLRTLLHSIAQFGSQVKLADGVLSVTADVSDLNISELHPSRVSSCLQQHILRLQSISEKLKQITEPEARPDPAGGEAGPICRRETSEASEQMEVDSEHASPTSHQTDDNVQIKAGKSEIERRISAFIERKQLEINENNVREFCNVIDCNQEDSCARTDAVFTPYPGFKSHVKVTRVINTYGPQTRGVHAELGDMQQGSAIRDCGNPAVEERLHNMEVHLKLPPAGPVPQNVYQRLKKLEDRILELEGLSPEYFHSTNYSHKRPKVSVSQSYSLAELDGKISAVKAALLKKTSEFRPTDAGEFPY